MRGVTLQSLVPELQLRVTLMLGWRDAVAMWAALRCRPGDSSSSLAPWRKLVAGLVSRWGHDRTFLTDLSLLRDIGHYKLVLGAYKELYPDVICEALMLQYSPSRMLLTIVAIDDVETMRAFVASQRCLTVEAHVLNSALQQHAVRCAELLLHEARLTARAQTCGGRRVKIEYPTRVYTDCQGAASDFVDFDLYPQRLLWTAASTGLSSLCDAVLAFLEECCLAASTPVALPAAAGAGSVEGRKVDRLRLWAACCGAACGNVPLLEFCGGPLLCGPLSRVSFRAPCVGGCPEVSFDEAPLAVVAAARGHVGALEALGRLGVDLLLCTRRGLTAQHTARSHKSAAQRERLCKALVLAPCGSRPPTPTARMLAAAAAAVEGPLALDAAGEGGPLMAAIERGDLAAVRLMLQRGARLEVQDLMAAVRSGDLDVLAFVQGECSSAAGKAEFRKMMSQTAAQIRENSRSHQAARASLSTSASGTVLRQAGAAMALGRASPVL